MAQYNPFPPRKYCPRHMVTWCIEITEECPYCLIEKLEAQIKQAYEDYDEAWGLYQQSEDLHAEIRKMPKRWREDWTPPYWEDPVDCIATELEQIYE